MNNADLNDVLLERYRRTLPRPEPDVALAGAALSLRDEDGNTLLFAKDGQLLGVAGTLPTLTYAASVALDFAADQLATITLAGNLTLTTSHLGAGLTKTIRLIGDGSLRTLTFPAWKFVGAAAPASLAASKVAILTVTSFGTTDAACVAAYAAEP